MLTHVTLKVLFFQNSTLIIKDIGAACKDNFYDKRSVCQKAEEMLAQGIVLCPKCKGTLKLHKCYPRHYKDEMGERHDGWVAQYHCGSCNTYHSFIPAFLMPYKHYEAKVIETALSAEKLSDCPADDSTIRRWGNQFKERGEVAVGWLLSILVKVYEIAVSTLEFQNKSLLDQLARLLQAFPIRQTGGVIGRTNEILTGFHSGYI